MTSPAERFYKSIKTVSALNQAKMIDLFAYFVQEELGNSSISPLDIKNVFEACDLTVPARIAAHLSERSKGRKP